MERHCPNCRANAQYAGQLYKCENCGGVYCLRCTNDCGGGCPFCGSHDYKSF